MKKKLIGRRSPVGRYQNSFQDFWLECVLEGDYLSVQQPDCRPRWCLSGTRSTHDGVQTLENLRGCLTSSSLVLFCTLLALPLSYTHWIIKKLEHTQATGKIYRNSPLWTLGAAKIPVNLCLFLSTGLSVQDFAAIIIKSFCLHSNKRRFLCMFIIHWDGKNNCLLLSEKNNWYII